MKIGSLKVKMTSKIFNNNESNGYGLKNLHKRIEILFGNESVILRGNILRIIRKMLKYRETNLL